MLTLITACGGEEFSQGGVGGAGSGAISGSSGMGNAAGTSGSGATSGAAGAAAASGSGGVGGVSGGSGGVGAAGGGGSAGVGATGGKGGSSGVGAAGGAGGSGATGGTCGVNQPGLLLHSELNNLFSIENPAKNSGSGGGTAKGVTFHAGKCEKAVRIDATGERVEFPQPGNLDLKKGSVDFWYRPDTAHDDGAPRTFVITAGGTTANSMQIRKAGVASGNNFNVEFRDGGDKYHKTSVAPDQYTFFAKQWIRIVVTWDLSVTEQVVHVYFNGKEPKNYAAVAKGPLVISNPSTGGFIVGTTIIKQDQPIGGLIDEFKVYETVIAP